MDDAKSQLVEKLGTATNILVTVSRDPSVDQLAACIGLTLLLNKFGKHATAVFSGAVPSTLEFLEPENTLEKTTDSLRDFIIALDKSKADKLRYKVEDEMVRIFITPYHTSLSKADLEFSQGDFNIDVVIALGVNAQEDFDEAITAHGRILHDAVVSSINTSGGVDLGSINWLQPAASSLSELIVDLAHNLAPSLLDGQIATALLTGIISETARFSNEKTTPLTMSVSAELMAAGANQQLVATKLDEAEVTTHSANNTDESSIPSSNDEPEIEPPVKPQDGMLEIHHESETDQTENEASNDENLDLDDAADQSVDDEPESAPDESIDEDQPEAGPHEVASEATAAADLVSEAPASADATAKTSKMIFEPPSMGGQLTANSETESLDPAVNPLNELTGEKPSILNRSSQTNIQLPSLDPAPQPVLPAAPTQLMTGFTPPPPAWVPPSPDGPQFKPADFLKAEPSPLTEASPKPAASAEIPEPAPEVTAVETVEDARDEVMKALSAEAYKPEPVQALGAQPLGEPLRLADPLIPAVDANPSFASVLQQTIPLASPAAAVALPSNNLPIPEAGQLPPPVMPAPAPAAPVAVFDPTAPPPVPPPIPFNFGPPPAA